MVVRDPSGGMLLGENTTGQQCAGNIWTCIICGPQYSSVNSDNLYQLGTPSQFQQDPNVGTAVNQGTLMYKSHGQRFNYVFCDGHTEALKLEQTIGSGTMSNPKGIWTVAVGGD